MSSVAERELRTLLGARWTPYTVSNEQFLVKMAVPRTHGLCFLATDLVRVWYECLSPLDLARRLQSAMLVANDASQSTQNQSQNPLSGEELDRAVASLVSSVEDGKATLDFVSKAYENIFAFEIPASEDLPSSLTLRFICDLAADSGAILKEHLLKPALGVSASLLSVCRDARVDESAISDAIDVSGTAENARAGSVVRAFCASDGAGFGSLQRWSQRAKGVQDQYLAEVSLRNALPSVQSIAHEQRNSFNSSKEEALRMQASATKRQREPSPAASPPPSAQASSSARTAASNAQDLSDEPATESEDEAAPGPSATASPSASAPVSPQKRDDEDVEKKERMRMLKRAAARRANQGSSTTKKKKKVAI